VTLKAPDRHPSRQQLKHCYVLKAQHNWSLQYEAFFSSHLLVVFFYQNVHIANSAIVELKAITRNYIKDFEKSTDRQMKHSLVQNLKTCSFFLIPAVKPRYLIRTIRVALTLAKSWLRIVAVYNPNTLLHPIKILFRVNATIATTVLQTLNMADYSPSRTQKMFESCAGCP